MLTLLKITGSYFSAKRRQILKINYYAEKINAHWALEPEQALIYANKLSAYSQKLANDKSTSSTVLQWLIENPPAEIVKKINHVISNNKLKENIRDLSAKVQLSGIYSDYDSKDSFRTLIQKRLDALDEDFKVVSLQSHNSPVVHVNNEQSQFIIRFLRMNKDEESSGNSPRIARELLDDVHEISKPYLVEHVEDDNIEVTFIEFSEYYENGNLEQYFAQLRLQKAKKLITSSDFEKTLLSYTSKIVAFFITINQKNIWFTDLKPSNILLNNDNDIVISDIKGLIIAFEKEIATNKTNTSRSYYQSTVFSKNKINLERLQRQTLATTMYQLACGSLPAQNDLEDLGWRNCYDFDRPVFQSEIGVFLQHLIHKLNLKTSITMPAVLNLLTQKLSLHDDLSTGVLLEDQMAEVLPPPRATNFFNNAPEF